MRHKDKGRKRETPITQSGTSVVRTVRSLAQVNQYFRRFAFSARENEPLCTLARWGWRVKYNHIKKKVMVWLNKNAVCGRYTVRI